MLMATCVVTFEADEPSTEEQTYLEAALKLDQAATTLKSGQAKKYRQKHNKVHHMFVHGHHSHKTESWISKIVKRSKAARKKKKAHHKISVHGHHSHKTKSWISKIMKRSKAARKKKKAHHKIFVHGHHSHKTKSWIGKIMKRSKA